MGLEGRQEGIGRTKGPQSWEAEPGPPPGQAAGHSVHLLLKAVCHQAAPAPRRRAGTLDQAESTFCLCTGRKRLGLTILLCLQGAWMVSCPWTSLHPWRCLFTESLPGQTRGCAPWHTVTIVSKRWHHISMVSHRGDCPWSRQPFLTGFRPSDL